MPAREWTPLWLALRLSEREMCPAIQACRTVRLRWQWRHRQRRRQLLASRRSQRWERRHLTNQVPRSRPWAGRRPSKTRATQSGSDLQAGVTYMVASIFGIIRSS